MKDFKNYINGKWVTSAHSINVINPVDESISAKIYEASPEQVQEALESAQKAQKAWSRLTGVDRGYVMRKWAALIDRNKTKLANLLTEEVGKPITESLGEIDFGNNWLKYYAEFDRRIEGEWMSPDNPGEVMWNIPQPIGVVVGIIAWNFPFAMALRKIAPAMITGNAIVFKPHEDTSMTALALVELGEKAGLPPGIVNVVCGYGNTVGVQLVKSEIPQLITFTGGSETGKKITKMAANNLTTISMELGGKAPMVILNDADLDMSVENAYSARMLNCGQACICNERTYVQSGIADKFIKKFIKKMQKTIVGDPFKRGTQLGPKVNKTELEKVRKYVNKAKKQGAEIALGGDLLKGGMFNKGYWYQPTVILNPTQNMEIMQKEIFGPVIPIMQFDSFEEGIQLANDTKFGLAGYIMTNDMNKIMRAVRDMEVGELYVNRSLAESIHGYHAGWKNSGIGGDDGKHGLEHYMRRKTVYLKYQV
ncbi:MAG: aldehyde dehydrogenase [Bacteroidetes bacterium]|nr:MAG: aldehyde dehydrogenase [Bacteroidota bacterium]